MPRIRTSDVVNAETEQCTFADIALSAPLIKSLGEMGCVRPSPVQLRGIPAILQSDGDVLVQAKSGTGKTITFGAPILESIQTAEDATQALILGPTREIALQITDELRRLGWYLQFQLSAECFVGGSPLDDDVARLQEFPCHVAIGTPGRILKLLRKKKIHCSKLRFFVMDEADKLLDHNFRNDIRSIVELSFNKELRYVGLSATFPPPMVTEAETLFSHCEKKEAMAQGLGRPPDREEPKQVFLCTSAVKKGEDGYALGGVGDERALESAVLRGVIHCRYIVEEGFHIRQKLPALLEVLTSISYRQAFVFCNHSASAQLVAQMLIQAGVPACATSGRMEQSWRAEAFVGVKTFQYRVLVCSDLFARGVDIEKVDVVVNLDLPLEKETYLHRSGRAARFGATGWCISVLFDGEEAGHLDYFQVQLGFDVVEFHERDQVFNAEETVPDVKQRLDVKSKHLLQNDEDIVPHVKQRSDVKNKHLLQNDEHREGEEVDEECYEEDWEEDEEEFYEGWEEEEAEEEEELDEEANEVSPGKWHEVQKVDAAMKPASTRVANSKGTKSGMFGGVPAAPTSTAAPVQAPRVDMVKERHMAAPPLPPGQTNSCGELPSFQQSLRSDIPSRAPFLGSSLGCPADQFPHMAETQKSVWTFAGCDLFSRFPPPPIAVPEEQLPPEVFNLVASWEPWMDGCSTMDQYLYRRPVPLSLKPPAALMPDMRSHPFQRTGSVQERMDELWLRHQLIWRGAA